MLSKTLRQIISFGVVFVTILFFAGVQFAQAQSWTPPTGPPPNNNAPAPIHEGSLGQGKGFFGGALPNHTIGATYFNALEGYLGYWGVFDKQGVATTRVCLGSTDQIESSGFPDGLEEEWSAAGLNCIDYEDGWQIDGGDMNFPDGEPHRILYFDVNTQQWENYPFIAAINTQGQRTFQIGSNEGSWDLPNWARLYVDGEFRTDAGQDDVSATNLGALSDGQVVILPTVDLVPDINGDGRDDWVPVDSPAEGDILTAINENGSARWMSPADIGLGGGGGFVTNLFSPLGFMMSSPFSDLGLSFGSGLQTEVIADNSFGISLLDGQNAGDILVWNGASWEVGDSSLPTADFFGQVLYWNDSGDGDWALSQGATFDTNNISVDYDAGRFKYTNAQDDCEAGAVLRMGIFEFDDSLSNENIECINGLRVIDSDEAPQVYVDTLAHGLDNILRPVCTDDEGGLVTCGNLSTGSLLYTNPGGYTFTVPDGVFEIEVTLTGAGGGGGGGGLGRSHGVMSGNSALWDQIYGGGGGGAGGGKGEVVTETISVIPGTQHNIVVGFGGLGGCQDTPLTTSWTGGSSHCDGIAWNMNGSAPHNGFGTEGGESMFSCNGLDYCDTVTAEGGQGGGRGWTLYGDGISSGAAQDALNALGVEGGIRGLDGDGGDSAQDGYPGDVWYYLGSEDPDPGVCTAFNDKPLYHYAGGRGGNGAGGAIGGNGGPFVPMTSTTYSPGLGQYPIGCIVTHNSFSGHGSDGQFGVGPGGGGAGGGGGNSQIPYGGDQRAWHFGVAGRGGNGAPGSVFISW